MRSALERLVAGLLAIAGAAIACGYFVALLLADHRTDAVRSWGAPAAFGIVGIVLGAGWLAASTTLRRERTPLLRIPSFALGFGLVVATIGAGFAIAYWDIGVGIVPVLAAIALAGVALMFLRLAVYWVPGRRIALDDLAYPGLWGALAAPLLVLPVQALAVAGVVFAALAGASIGDPDLVTDLDFGSRVEGYLETNASDASPELPGVLSTPTGAFAMFAVIAVVAPLTEELAKALGALLSLRWRAEVTERSAFLAAVSAGLGFAVIEGLGYALIDPLVWYQVLLFRAPIVIIHVAATTIVVLGWHRMLRRGGYGLFWYYLVAVGLHAAWNGLFVALMLVATSVDGDQQPGPAESVALLALVAGLAATFVAATIWLVLNARRIGLRERAPELAPGQQHPPAVATREYPRAGVPAS